MEHCHCEERYESHELVECIANALDARDPYTGNHSRRVSDMACMLCRYLGLSEQETQTIHIAAHLHDIGKIGIPDAILCKPGRLDDREWGIMKDHPKIGAEILCTSPHFAEIGKIIQHHHERYDGKGYPNSSELDYIPLGARIIAVCDSIDAMASARAYRKALPLDTCRSEIEKNIGTMYDPQIAMTALTHWDELTAMYREENENSYKISIDIVP
ncbi:MAG: HD-GYP domain-containing protein [Clostridia bacterium]|nr:HD-GYP domain-containing protein [Clostridia bacterium]